MSFNLRKLYSTTLGQDFEPFEQIENYAEQQADIIAFRAQKEVNKAANPLIQSGERKVRDKIDGLKRKGEELVQKVKKPDPTVPEIINPSSEALLNGSFNYRTPLGGSFRLPCRLDHRNLRDIHLYQLPNEPIISVKGGKQITTTNIRRTSGIGTVKEERALKDFQITIKGIALNTEETAYPTEQITRIKEICTAPGVVYIDCELTSLFGIHQLSIVDFDFPRSAEQNIIYQAYVIRAVSDFDFPDFKKLMEEPGPAGNIDGTSA